MRLAGFVQLILEPAGFLSAYFGSRKVFCQLILDLTRFCSTSFVSRKVFVSLFWISQGFVQLILSLAGLVSTYARSRMFVSQLIMDLPKFC